MPILLSFSFILLAVPTEFISDVLNNIPTFLTSGVNPTMTFENKS